MVKNNRYICKSNDMKETQQLLHSLYAIHAPTGCEWQLICFVRDYLSANVSEAEVRMDSWGNLYVTKGKSDVGYPLLCCHLDQVQTVHSEDFEVHEEDGMLYGWSNSRQCREGLGADDKNGIWVCLRCLEMCEHLKVFMAVGEEKGCIGSNRADMEFFADCLYALEPDCKGDKEIHTNLRGIPCASMEFEAALEVERHGYTFTEGKTTDLLALTLNGLGVSCANIPVGYYLPHKDEEYTVVAELEHCLDFVRHTVQTLRCRYPHEYKTETQKMIEKLA